MSAEWGYSLVACVIVCVIGGLYITSDLRKTKTDGWVLYYTKSCGHCINQINELGWGGLWFINAVDCTSANTIKPPDITAFPTWKNTVTGKVHLGMITRDKLFSTLA